MLLLTAELSSEHQT